MKISHEQAAKLLSELLGDVEIVESDKSDGIEDEVILTDIKEAVKPEIEAELSKTLEASIGARSNGTALSAIQQVFGIPKKELDGKNFKEMFNIVKAHVSDNTGKEANEWKEKYEATVQDYESQLETVNTTWQTKYDSDLGNERKRYIDRDINDVYLQQISKIARQGGDPTKQAKVMRSLIQSEGYEEVYDEAKKQLVFKKDGKVVKVDETLAALAKDVLPVATSTNHINPNDVRTGKVVPDGGVKVEQPTNIPAASQLGEVLAWVNGQ